MWRLAESCFKHRKFLWWDVFTIEKFNFASEQSQFQSVGVARTEFYLFELFSFWVLKKVVLKLQKFCWRNIFIIEMFIFPNFVQKIDFEPSHLGLSHLQKLNVVLAEFYSFQLPWLRLLRENCFKVLRLTWDEYFYHLNVYFC